MSTATTVSRTPSAWRLGMVNIKPAVISCLATVFAQFALNALTPSSSTQATIGPRRTSAW